MTNERGVIQAGEGSTASATAVWKGKVTTSSKSKDKRVSLNFEMILNRFSESMNSSINEIQAKVDLPPPPLICGEMMCVFFAL